MEPKAKLSKRYKELVFGRVPKNIHLLVAKLHHGVNVTVFKEKGNGIKFLTNQFGRFSDFPGIYVLVSGRGEPLLIRQSKNVFRDIQRTVRGNRNKDIRIMMSLAEKYNDRSVERGEKEMESLNVIWEEITNEIERRLLVRMLKSKWSKYLIEEN